MLAVLKLYIESEMKGIPLKNIWTVYKKEKNSIPLFNFNFKHKNSTMDKNWASDHRFLKSKRKMLAFLVIRFFFHLFLYI